MEVSGRPDRRWIAALALLALGAGPAPALDAPRPDGSGPAAGVGPLTPTLSPVGEREPNSGPLSPRERARVRVRSSFDGALTPALSQRERELDSGPLSP